MRHLIINSITALLVLVGCNRGPTASPLNKPKLRIKYDIVIQTRNLTIPMHKAAITAAGILDKEVFRGHKGCPKVHVSRFLGKTRIPQDGINIYDHKNNVVWPTLNNCRQPYAAISKDRKTAVINLCRQRITDAVWSHALDPDVYLIMHNIAKILGLQETVSRRGVASYTANDRRVRAERLGYSFMFRFRASEKKALRKHYCRKGN